MAWEISHTAEAMFNARNNTARLDSETLAVIWAEQKMHDIMGDENVPFKAWNRRYVSLLLRGRKKVQQFRDAIVNDIFEWAELHGTCSNGGFQMWLCADGCHTVSFDDESLGEINID